MRCSSSLIALMRLRLMLPSSAPRRDALRYSTLDSLPAPKKELVSAHQPAPFSEQELAQGQRRGRSVTGVWGVWPQCTPGTNQNSTSSTNLIGTKNMSVSHSSRQTHARTRHVTLPTLRTSLQARRALAGEGAESLIRSAHPKIGLLYSTYT